MTDPDKIYADAGEPATLHYSGRSVPSPTLQEAVLEWMRLAAEDRERATIQVNVPGGPTYTAKEINRLHIASKPK